MRFSTPQAPNLPQDLDPKSAWALAHPEFFPVELSRASLGEMLRVPGLGPTSAKRILAARRASRLQADTLARIGLVMKKARYFISLYGRRLAEAPLPERLRPLLSDGNSPSALGGVGDSTQASALIASAPLQMEFGF